MIHREQAAQGIGISMGAPIVLAGCRQSTVSVKSAAVLRRPAPIRIVNMNTKIPPPPWTPSLEAAEKAVRSAHHAATARYELGLAVYKAGRYGDAVQALDQVAKQFPNSQKTNFWLACSCMGDNNLPRAVGVLVHITQIAGASKWYSTQCYAMAGYCYYDMYDDANARERVKKAIAIDNNNARAKAILDLLRSQ